MVEYNAGVHNDGSGFFIMSSVDSEPEPSELATQYSAGGTDDSMLAPA